MAGALSFADLEPDSGATADRLLPVVTSLETGGSRDPNNAVSKTGALGRNQIQPTTAIQYGYDPATLNDGPTNDAAARTILADLAHRYPGDDGAVLAGYNGGPGRAAAYVKAGDDPSVLPAETQGYLKKSGVVPDNAPTTSGQPLGALGLVDQTPDLQPEPDKSGALQFDDLVPGGAPATTSGGALSFADLVPGGASNAAMRRNGAGKADDAAAADAAYAAAHKGQPAPDMTAPAGKPDPSQKDPGLAAGWTQAQLDYADTHGIPLSLAPPEGWLSTLAKGAENFGSAVKKGAGEQLSGLAHVLQTLGTQDGAAPIPALNERAAQGEQIAKAGQAAMDANAPAVPAGSAKDIIYKGITGIGEGLPAIVAAAVTKSSGPAVAGFFAQGYGDAYDRSLKLGRTPDQAKQDAIVSGAATALPAELPLSEILKPGANVIKRMVGSGLGMGAANAVTTAVQQAYDAGVLHMNMTWGQALSAIKDSAVSGFLPGAIFGLLGHVGAKKEADAAQEPETQSGTQPPPPPPGAPPAGRSGAAPRVEPTFAPKPTVPDDVANPPAPLPPRADLTPVHDPVTWAQTGWQDKDGNVLPLDAPAVEPASKAPAAAPAADQTAAIIADQPSAAGEALAREFPKVPPKEPDAQAKVPATEPDAKAAALQALQTNIDPATGSRPKGNAALREFRGRMQAIVDNSGSEGQSVPRDVTHETSPEDVQPVRPPAETGPEAVPPASRGVAEGVPEAAPASPAGGKGGDTGGAEGKSPSAQPGNQENSGQVPAPAKGKYDPAAYVDEARAALTGAKTPPTAAALGQKIGVSAPRAAKLIANVTTTPDPGFDEALGRVRAARAPMPKGETVGQAIRRLGGLKLKDASGNMLKGGPEIRDILDGNPGLLNNKTGKAPDAMREALSEEGWFTGANDSESSGIDDLHDLLGRHMKGEKIYHPTSDAANDLYGRQMQDEELGRAGVSSNDSEGVAARKLATFRQEWGDAVADRNEDVIPEQHLAGLDESDEKVLHDDYGYEPGSDIGEESEASEGAPGRSYESEDFPGWESENRGSSEAPGGRGEVPERTAGPAEQPAAAGHDAAVARSTPDADAKRIAEITRNRGAEAGQAEVERLTPPEFKKTGAGAKYAAQLERAVKAEMNKSGEEEADHYQEPAYLKAPEYMDAQAKKKTAREALAQADKDLESGKITEADHEKIGDAYVASTEAVDRAINAHDATKAAPLKTEAGADGLDQTIVPGGERSAQQLAAAREAEGHGRSRAKAPQKEAGGLFEPKTEQTEDMFAAKPASESKPEATPEPAETPLPKVEKVASKKPEPEILQDAGEKIGGARKNRWAERGMRVSDLEGMSEGEAFQHVTKDAVWPKPDYAKMVEAGTDPHVAAQVKIIRDRLAAKPRVDSAQGRRDYVEMMGHVRAELEGVKTAAELKDARHKIIYDRLKWGNNAINSPEAKAARDKLFSIFNGRHETLAPAYADSGKAKKMIDAGFPGDIAPWTRRFDVRQSGNGFFITEKGKYRTLEKDFPTREDAAKRAAELYEDKKDENGKLPPPARPALDKVERTGPDIRKARDVSGDDFVKDFGFRGVEFGNWVAGDERQKSVNLAYDGLHDLAETLGIPPEALSLDGKLGLAFGARGSGKAAAHYEPGKLVINLTKTSGAGSLAHEWGHALDHHFGVLDKPKGTKGETEGASGWYNATRDRMPHLKNLRPAMANAFDKLMSSMFRRDKERAEAVRDAELRLETLQGTLDKYKGQLDRHMEQPKEKQQPTYVKQSQEYLKTLELQKSIVEDRLGDLRDDAKPYVPSKTESSFYSSAKALSGKAGEKGYWARPTELLARSFESYVFDKLKAQGRKSQYLVQGVEPDRYASGYAGNPYPAGKERDSINNAYDHLFDEMQTREGEHGPVLFSRRTEEEKKPFYSALTKHIEDLKQERAPAAQWASVIDNAKSKGVKQEEIDWSGVKDWLGEQKGPVSKSDLLQHLRENEVQLQEVEKGTKWPAEKTAEYDRKRREIEDLRDRGGQISHDAAKRRLDALDKEYGASEYDGLASDGGRRTPTKFSNYKLPGGENYRELLMTMPKAENDPWHRINKQVIEKIDALADKGVNLADIPKGDPRRAEIDDLMAKGNAIEPGREFKSGHWDEPNILAHVRFDDRTGPNGEKILHMAEVQSDWHQAGRRKGYANHDEAELDRLRDDSISARNDMLSLRDKKIAEVTGGRTKKEVLDDGDKEAFRRIQDLDKDPEFMEAVRRADEAASRVSAANNGVPDAPFKSSWHELALKRMLRYAAEHGYDKLSWDRGETQVDRYDLSKSISRIDLEPWKTLSGGKTEYVVTAHDHSGRKVLDKNITDFNELPDLIGKDAADKLTTGENKERMDAGIAAKLEGLDLKVGGEGMKGFYDKILPNFLNKYGKKWGAKVEDTHIKGDADKDYGPLSVAHNGDDKYWVASDTHGKVSPYFDSAIKAMDARDAMKSGPSVHGIDITPAMKEGVMGDQPMFQETPPKGWGGEGATDETRTQTAENRQKELAYPHVDPANNAKRKEIGDALRERMDKMGLHDIALRVPDWIKVKTAETPMEDGRYVDGMYSPLRKAIHVAMDSQHGVEHVLDHEGIHAMRDLGVFTDPEWKILTKKAGDEWVDKYNIRKNYIGSPEEKMLEEGVAHAYPDWVRGKLGNAGNAISRIFRKMSNFLEATRNAVQGLGFKSADDIFKGIQSGEIGNRGAEGEPPDDKTDPSFARRQDEEPEEKPKPGFIRRAITKPLDDLLGPKTEKIGQQINDAAAKIVPESVVEAKDAVKMALAPMATGTHESRAAAKDFANGMRMARMIGGRQQDYLKENFDHTQHEKMWEAADEQSVLMQQDKKVGTDEGYNRLDPNELAAVKAFQADNREAAREAIEVGILNGELPSYVPRMGVAIAADGEIGRLGYGGETASGLDAIGRNLRTTTPNMKQRKYLTADETEEAMKGISQDAVLVKDFRTLPLATARLREAIAGRRLINAIDEIGKNSGELTVSDGVDPTGTDGTDHKWFTLDHPAFKTYRPKLVQNEETGKYEVLNDENGNPIFEKVPKFVRGDFEGPLRAVLSTKTGPIYKAFMDIKGKSMSVIMYSPMLHNAVIWGKAFPVSPKKLLTPWYRGADGKLRPGLQLYGEGRVAKNDPVVMKEAVGNGLDPIGHRYFNQDITGMMEQDNLKPGRSWTAQVLAAVPNLFSKDAGDSVKRAIDKAGDVWHNKFLWDLVGDLQMGLYKHIRDGAIKDGHDPQTAGRLAAHFANRYAGALPIESMSKAARQTANFLMFSRSFTLTNLGAFKDLVRGLPQDVQSQILRDKGIEALNNIQGTARRKAATMLAMDIFLSHVGTFMAQYALAYYMGRQFTAPSDNEPDKENRFLINYQKDGTGVYGRLPTGKVGEDLQDWVTEPADIGNRKLSAYGRLAYGLAANDAGFGRQIYDKHDHGMGGYARNIGRIAEFTANSILPLSAFDGMKSLAENKGEAKTNLMKILLPMAGITVSKGAPGGPALGQLYDTKEENEFQVGEKMPDVRAKIAAGDVDGAAKELAALGFNKNRAKMVIRSIENPGSRLTKSQMKQFERTATPDDKAKMQTFQEQQKQNKAPADQHSALDAGDLKGAVSNGTLEKFAASGQTWTRQDAVKATSAAGMPATTAILREAKDPLSPALQKLATSYGVG